MPTVPTNFSKRRHLVALGMLMFVALFSTNVSFISWSDMLNAQPSPITKENAAIDPEPDEQLIEEPQGPVIEESQLEPQLPVIEEPVVKPMVNEPVIEELVVEPVDNELVVEPVDNEREGSAADEPAADERQQPSLEPQVELIEGSDEGPQDLRQIVIVVPGFGDIQRLPQLKETLTALQQSSISSATVVMDCLVYVWKDELLETATNELDFCTVQLSHGVWTHHMLKVGHNESSAMMERATHVAILMDDVDVRAVDLPQFLDTMERVSYNVASPSYDHYYYNSCWARPYCMAHKTQHLDILFTVYTVEKWQCWYDALDIDINVMGWGYDVTMADICNATIGVIDYERMDHPPAGNDRSYSTAESWGQMLAWMDRYKHLSNIDDAQAYLRHVGFDRPKTLPYCDEILFHVPLSWRTEEEVLVPPQSQVLQGLQALTHHSHSGRTSSFHLTTNPIPMTNPKHNHTRSIELIDSVDDWFGTRPSSKAGKLGVIKDKWVGFVRHATSASRNDTVWPADSWLSSEDLFVSTPNCIALFVFTKAMSVEMEEALFLQDNTKVAICAVDHPIVQAPLSSLFDPVVDLKIGQSALVLWGRPMTSATDELLVSSQQPRIASLHSLCTKRRKIWLVPGDGDQTPPPAMVTEQLDDAGVERDNNVVVKNLDSSDMTLDEYATILRQNIVLVDTWTEGSYLAAVDALTFQTPFLMRRRDGFIQYLGEDYPMFFSSLDEVQSLLDNEGLLQRKLLEAHEYLKARDTSRFTYESLAQQMVQCTLDVMLTWEHD